MVELGPDGVRPERADRDGDLISIHEMSENRADLVTRQWPHNAKFSVLMYSGRTRCPMEGVGHHVQFSMPIPLWGIMDGVSLVGAVTIRKSPPCDG